MSKVKYRVRHYNPTEEQGGSHSVFAEVVLNNEINNAQLAKKIAARTGFKAYECQAVIAAIADIVQEEVLESNAISLANEEGTKMVKLYPRVSGSISDAQITEKTTALHAIDASVEVRTVAQESDLTPDMLKWSIGATVGTTFSKFFSINKRAQKVQTVSASVAGDTEDDDEGGENNGGNGGGGGEVSNEG